MKLVVLELGNECLLLVVKIIESSDKLLLLTLEIGHLFIEIFEADHTAYSKKLDKVVMMREAPDHAKEDFVLLSGTKVREMLGKGMAPPPEFSRPEVAKVLMDYYQSTQ